MKQIWLGTILVALLFTVPACVTDELDYAYSSDIGDEECELDPAQCVEPGYCGDGVVQKSLGEDCDPGDIGAQCTPECYLAYEDQADLLVTVECSNDCNNAGPAEVAPPETDRELTVASSWEDAMLGIHQNSFQFGEVVDLVFVTPTGAEDEGLLATLDIFAPSGALMTRYQVPVTDLHAAFVVPVLGAALGTAQLTGSYRAEITINDVTTEGGFEMTAAEEPEPPSDSDIGFDF